MGSKRKERFIKLSNFSILTFRLRFCGTHLSFRLGCFQVFRWWSGQFVLVVREFQSFHVKG